LTVKRFSLKRKKFDGRDSGEGSGGISGEREESRVKDKDYFW